MIAIVIPVGPGREENLRQCLLAIAEFGAIGRWRRPGAQDRPPVVLVGDGVDVDELVACVPLALRPMTGALGLEKHVRSLGRNQGVRYVRGRWPDATHVWFVDSDVVLEPGALDAMSSAIEESSEPRILVGPYDWMPEGWRPELPGSGWALRNELLNDPRRPAFETNDPSRILRGDIMAGFACFSGNLVWPIEEFERIGGFWSEICGGEDGELGLRAVKAGVGISFVAEARGYHLWHPVDMQGTLAANARDMPMIDARHPWATALLEPGHVDKATAVRCFRCGQTVPTIQWWAHTAGCA